jgi:hypothetical protein
MEQVMTKRIHGVLVALSLIMGPHPGVAQSQHSAETVANVRGPLEKMPLSLEVRLALSALPPTLRENATVYILDPAKGYVLERLGTNGQSCFVGRTEWKFADYRNDVFDPICYDAVGAKNQMRVWFDVAELRAKGVKPEAMKNEIEARYRSGVYAAPDRPGLSYMTAPLMRSYMSLDPKDKDSVMTMSMPHVMYYAPGITAADVGGMPCPPCAPYPFVFEPGPHGYVIQRLGDRESAKIVEDEADLVRDLCSYRSVLCLSQHDSKDAHPA